VWFHPNGKVARAGSYDNHEWTGRWWSFDDQGRLESSIAYVAGKEEGLAVHFHADGKRRSESYYRAGKLDGPSKMWTEAGELMSITTYKDDAVVGTRVFQYTLKEASPQDVAAARDELRKLLDEQKKAMEAQ
jgi:antitoxin component YwqK of YwqJK toxin-antitoxin module